MSDWNFARTWNDLAEVVPDREAVVCGPLSRTYRELTDRGARLASHLAGLGVEAGDRVAVHMANRPEYLETFLAALDLGAIPVNVNYRYGAEETAYVLADSRAVAVVTEPTYVATVEEAVRSRPADVPEPAVVCTGDGYEAALAAADPDGPGRSRRPEGDDLIFVYTGGTTGMPKGVMWRADDLYVALWQMSRPGSEPPDPVAGARAGKRAATGLPACPLMHGTGLFMALSTLSGGGTVVLVDRPGLDPEVVWSEVERNRVAVLTIVGDAFARPLLAALDAEPARWDLSALRAITSSGVTWSPETKAGLLTHLPHVTLLDSLGSSEGLVSRNASAHGEPIAPARFAVGDRVRVLADDGRDVAPGSGEVGLVAVSGRIPLGYHGDPEKTAATFRTVGGVRYSVPGDHATVEADGSIRLLGRGSACINTGGEKVYPEEVELALRSHPGVFDCLVVGIPDDRFGEKVVALVQPRETGGVRGAGGAHGDPEPGEEALRRWCRERLAGYKVPRRMLYVDSLGRSAAGKADYNRLRALAAELDER